LLPVHLLTHYQPPRELSEAIWFKLRSHWHIVQRCVVAVFGFSRWDIFDEMLEAASQALTATLTVVVSIAQGGVGHRRGVRLDAFAK